MALIPLDKRFHPDFANPRVKPVGPVVIDESNEFATNLIERRLFRGTTRSVDGREVSVSESLSYTRNRASFNGSSDVINYGDVTKLNTLSHLTVSTIITLNNPTTSEVIIDKNEPGYGNGWSFFFNTVGINANDTFDVYWANGSAVSRPQPSTSFSRTGTYHIVFVLDPTQPVLDRARLYVDSIDVTVGKTGSSPATTLGVGEDYLIGKKSGGDPLPFSGEMGHVFMWDEAFTPEKVRRFTRDPYQVLKPAIPMKYFVGAAGGASTLTADSGSYTYTGTTLELQRGLDLAVDSGSYAYTGTNIDFQRGLVIAADSGSYTYSGTNIDLLVGSVLVSESGAYVYTGTAIDFAQGFGVVADSGAYVYTGTNVDFIEQRILTAESGSYIYTGTTANIFFSAVPADIPTAVGVFINGAFGSGVSVTSSFGTGVKVEGNL